MKKLLSLSLFAIILSVSQGYFEIANSSKKSSYSFKKDSEGIAQSQAPRKAVESAGPKKVKIVAKKSVEKKEELNRGNGTRGNYIGITGGLNQLNFHEEYTNDLNPSKKKSKPSATGYGYSAGLSYKYALNFHDFFVAPGAFVEKNWTSQTGNNDASPGYPAYTDITRLDIKSRIGVTADLGYDFTNKFAAYVMGGYSLIQYRAKNGTIIEPNYETALRNSTKGSAIFGLGAKYNVSDRVSFNIEANTQKINLKTNTDVSFNRDNGYLYESRYVGRFNALKIGVYYNF